MHDAHHQQHIGPRWEEAEEEGQRRRHRDRKTERESWCTSVMHYCRKCQCCYPGFRNYVRRVGWGGWWVLLKSQSDSSSSASLLLSDCIHTYMHKHTQILTYTQSQKSVLSFCLPLTYAHKRTYTYGSLSPYEFLRKESAFFIPLDTTFP